MDGDDSDGNLASASTSRHVEEFKALQAALLNPCRCFDLGPP
jgi:hypothetical protein